MFFKIKFNRYCIFCKGVHYSCQPYPDLKRTLVVMSERTGLSVSQVTDEVLYTGLVDMQELEELDD
ncbi:MAG: hypothetical protein CL909_08980 [Deltaproteobacteria bacterium]|nr:hypothetical protein [Deltaproteobacteria bacterium]